MRGRINVKRGAVLREKVVCLVSVNVWTCVGVHVLSCCRECVCARVSVSVLSCDWLSASVCHVMSML